MFEDNVPIQMLDPSSTDSQSESNVLYMEVNMSPQTIQVKLSCEIINLIITVDRGLVGGYIVL